LLTWSWVSLPSLSKPAHRELTVSVTLPSPPQPAPAEEPKPEPKPKPKPEPKPKPRPVEQQPAEPAPQAEPEVAEEAPAAPDAASSESAQPAAAPPGLPDRDPDYQAAYLKNPPPAYPMVARRMGWQGRVVLNVEVLASGLPGQVKLHQGSGHDVLDNAALKAVRNWRFVAARQGGQAVTKWFLIPIPFILKEAE
jgi:protein TonB